MCMLLYYKLKPYSHFILCCMYCLTSLPCVAHNIIVSPQTIASWIIAFCGFINYLTSLHPVLHILSLSHLKPLHHGHCASILSHLTSSCAAHTVSPQTIASCIIAFCVNCCIYHLTSVHPVLHLSSHITIIIIHPVLPYPYHLTLLSSCLAPYLTQSCVVPVTCSIGRARCFHQHYIHHILVAAI